MVPYLEMCGSNIFFCLGTEGSKGSLFRNGWFLMIFCLGTEGYRNSLLRNGWFQCISVKELKVSKDPY